MLAKFYPILWSQKKKKNAEQLQYHEGLWDKVSVL